jgi:hypothetical protein
MQKNPVLFNENKVGSLSEVLGFRSGSYGWTDRQRTIIV